MRKKKSRLVLTILILVTLVLLGGCSMISGDNAETEQTKPVSGNLNCVQISRFSGGFVEDGTDETVTDVAAILVENNTGKYIELATVTYQVGERTAEFRITGLPSGERCWVLEKSRMHIAPSDELIFEDCQVSYNKNPITQPPDLAVEREGKTLTLTNTTDKILKNVCVYYKNRMEDGTFMGGITYAIHYEDMAPGATIQHSTVHFSEESEIVRFSYQTA